MADDLGPQGVCLLSEIEGVLERTRQASSVKHAFAILACRIEDIACRYRYLAEMPPGAEAEDAEDEALREYLQGSP